MPQHDSSKLIYRTANLTAADLEVIDRDSAGVPPGEPVISLACNAVYERNEVEGGVSERWRFEARIVIRGHDRTYRAFTVNHAAPFVPVPLAEVTEWWRGEVVEFIVNTIIPNFFGWDPQ